MTRTVRADWQRSHERLIAAATDIVGRDGAAASLEAIARQAGVGSATLHRHFRSRRALLDAIFHDGIARLSQRADELAAGDQSPARALRTWLAELTTYTTDTRGVTTALLAGPDGAIADEDTCHGLIGDAANLLVDRAQRAGQVRRDVVPRDLVMLTNAISQAGAGDPVATRRMLDLVLDGVLGPT